MRQRCDFLTVGRRSLSVPPHHQYISQARLLWVAGTNKLIRETVSHEDARN